jgi:2-polyprenyl-3-methyl-5-hydroxy-6-metoxy-1,4-benzoquinol methylase
MAVDFLLKPTGYYAQIRTEMIGYIPSTSKRMLEIGCAEGNFGAYFKEKGLEVWGIEYSSAEAAVAATKLDKVYVGDIALHVDSLPDNYFDVIVCNDVLEHLIDPYIILEKFKTKLSAQGVVVSSIPNIRYFRTLYKFIFKKNWDYTDNGIMDKTHFRFFTINSIRKMYENLGYEIVSHEGINGSPSLKALFWNVITFGAFSDIKYLQFATVARVKK